MGVQKRQGFTIVELLIVIVVIAILATISVVAYNGIQSRARASQQLSVANSYVKAVKLYMADKGSFPLSLASNNIACFNGTTTCHSTANSAQSSALKTALIPYIGDATISATYDDFLVNYSSAHTRWYLYFSIPTSQECPATLSGLNFHTTTSGTTIRQCRYFFSA